MECKYLRIRKLHHNDGNESITYKCDNPKSNRYEKRSFYKGMVCNTCNEQSVKNEMCSRHIYQKERKDK